MIQYTIIPEMMKEFHRQSTNFRMYASYQWSLADQKKWKRQRQ